MKYGLGVAMDGRRNEAAAIITRFVRVTATVRSAAQFLLSRLHAVRQRRRLEGSDTPVLADTVNTRTVRRRRSRRGNVGGRPKKTKRGGGRRPRPPETPVVSMVCDMYDDVSTHHTHIHTV